MDIGVTEIVGGALASDNAIGTSDIETRTDATMKSSKPAGSAAFNRNCPPVTPPMVTTM